MLNRRQGLLTAAAAWPPRRSPPAPAGAARIVVLVPAHDESLGLLRTLRSLRREVAGDPGARIVVVADNCSDDTATVALSAGVEVLERHDPLRRGKGHALRFGFEAIDDADWFIVIDADTSVEPGSLAAMRGAMAGGGRAKSERPRNGGTGRHPADCPAQETSFHR